MNYRLQQKNDINSTLIHMILLVINIVYVGANYII